ncbi:MAG TPA: PEGA domain-containing protein [Blastocatellia bacterium]
MIKRSRNMAGLGLLLGLLVSSSCGGDVGSQPARASASPNVAANSNKSAAVGTVTPSASGKPSGGSIQVLSSPPGAPVMLIAVGEGFAGQPEPKGSTPVTITGVAPGKYAVDVEKPGYKYYQKEVEVKDGQTLKLNISLKKE